MSNGMVVLQPWYLYGKVLTMDHMNYKNPLEFAVIMILWCFFSSKKEINGVFFYLQEVKDFVSLPPPPKLLIVIPIRPDSSWPKMMLLHVTACRPGSNTPIVLRVQGSKRFRIKFFLRKFDQ